jgi:hypothetical protein
MSLTPRAKAHEHGFKERQADERGLVVAHRRHGEAETNPTPTSKLAF